eukprot:scaffold229506_cov13-Tisochrysis_lutea.AAC.1
MQSMRRAIHVIIRGDMLSLRYTAPQTYVARLLSQVSMESVTCTPVASSTTSPAMDCMLVIEE